MDKFLAFYAFFGIATGILFAGTPTQAVGCLILWPLVVLIKAFLGAYQVIGGDDQ
jgi:hypothetical protein